MVATLVVRPYQVSDRSELHRLAADTAFFGEPVERFIEDRRLFGDIMFAYYTDYEPAQAWVATADDQVVGFIVGSVDTTRQQRYLWREVVPRVMWRVLRGRYRTGPLTWQWLRRLGSSTLRRDVASADLGMYPAHLHIGVDARWRGRGGGRRLIERYLDHLHNLRVPGVHLRTTDRNSAACRLYEHLGMRLLEARPTRLWSHLLMVPVESRCYGLRLKILDRPRRP